MVLQSVHGITMGQYWQNSAEPKIFKALSSIYVRAAAN